jgi:HPt (histidine-containing phosphotransfer) domain-containing protein
MQRALCRAMLDIEFDELKREFLGEAEAKVKEIRSAIEGEFPPEKELLNRMINLAHQLKGAGGSYGFSGISIESAELEKDLEQVVQKPENGIRERLQKRVEALVSQIQKRRRELGSGQQSAH